MEIESKSDSQVLRDLAARASKGESFGELDAYDLRRIATHYDSMRADIDFLGQRVDGLRYQLKELSGN